MATLRRWLRLANPEKIVDLNGIADGDWLWITSPWGRVRARCQFSEAVEPGTVWTWNAVGKASGFWGLHPRAEESQTGFLLNHLIREELPANALGAGQGQVSNSDPVTGQAGWYDVRVRIDPAEAPPETDVDHINNDPTDNDLDNLAGMARECHSRKTQRDMGHKVAMGCDADGYPLDPDHDWQKSRESLGDKPTGSLYAHRRS